MVLFLSACGGGSDPVDDGASSPEVRCGTLGLTPKIFNGTECAESAGSPVVPLVIFASSFDPEAGLCSGTVLSPTRVLTAAHCIPNDARAVGVWGADGVVWASGWVVHPDFREESTGFFNDAAVVTVTASLRNASMALLLGEPAAVGQSVFIAGWGRTDSAGAFAFDVDPMDPTLTNVGDVVVGNASLSFVNQDHLGFVFSGRNSDTCQGDSGGPLYRDMNGRKGLLGITSFGSTAICGGNGRSVYTNIQTPAVLDFILEHAPDAQTF
ncbi:MAG TPA: trypsin-like serine protease [Hydrogenophaga sp.]|uniref:S1 family peptidase n=2 Tax=Hydrogenophaga sp. TaxID=1904254 RepID=UPI002CAA04A9|nr:trypsin-like serine protease [Hydrogenophaga sp.]HMN92864.1 trypsin-like serine protease [Hydrogenophaga sp.]